MIIKKNASLEVVSTIFTEINTQAQKLAAFDLSVAKFYRQSQGTYSLRTELAVAKAQEPNLTLVDRDGSNFLQSVALLAGKGNKKAALPENLDYPDLQTHGTNAFKGLGVASNVLQATAKIQAWDELPYDAMVPPLALAMLDYPTTVRARPPFQERVAKWVIAGALKRRYTEGTDVVQNEDKCDVVPWVLGREVDGQPAEPPAFVVEPWAVNMEVRNGSASSSRGKALTLALSNQRC